MRIINEDIVAIRNISWAAMHYHDDGQLVNWEVFDHSGHPAFKLYVMANIILKDTPFAADMIRDIALGR